MIPRMPRFLDLFQPDKLVHLFVFGVYIFLQIKGLSTQTVYAFAWKNAVVLALLSGLILAGGTELLQGYCIPMRTGSVYDFIANIAGCLIGWLVARYGLPGLGRS
jgi:VanZ family protein